MSTAENGGAIVDGLAKNDEVRPSPYVGLRQYTEFESPIFFGRDRDRKVIASNLVASRLTLLYGPSGVGKSSLLNAGVVADLRALADKDAEDGAVPFLVIAFNSWRDDPAAALLDCIATAAALVGYRGSPVDTGTPLAAALRAWTERLGCDLLIILDQFEEYFLYQGHGGHDRFGGEFPEAVNGVSLRANFVVALREDALAQLDLFKGRVQRLFGNRLRIEYLDADAARQAILGPVAAYNRAHPEVSVDVEPALVDRILEQVEAGKVVVGQAGIGSIDTTGDDSYVAIETSHLQIVMARLWQEESITGSRVLRAETLDRLGGAQQIVRAHVDDALGSLAVSDQDLAAAAFEHLVTPSGTKIAHSAPDLAYLARVPENDLVEVLKRLSSGTTRILRPVEPAPGRHDERYEIFHDVLAGAILGWRARYAETRTRAEAETKLRRQQEEAEGRLRRQHEVAEERARALRRKARRVVAAVVGAALILVLTVLLVEDQRRSHLERSRLLAAQARGYLSTDPAASIRTSLTALDVAHTDEAEAVLREAMADSTARAVLSGHRGGVNTVAFAPDGHRVVTSSSDRTARVWDVGGAAPVELPGHGGRVVSAMFSSTADRVLTVSWDGTARLWDASSGAPTAPPLEPGDSARVTAAAFDPSGARVVTAGYDNMARIWNAATGAQLLALSGHTASVNAASFDPTGTRVVTASDDGTVRVWDAEGGQELARWASGGERVLDAVSGGDGSEIAVAGADGQAYVWHWKTDRVVAVSGPSDHTGRVRFDARGDRVVTAGSKTPKVWDANTGQLVATLRGHTDSVNAAILSPDGARVATASKDGTARIWDTATEGTVAELSGHTESVLDVAFNPANPSVVATAGSDGTARLWELPTPETLSGHEDTVWRAEFSQDSHWVLTSSADGTARVWDARTGRGVRVFKGTGAVMAAMSPDARLVAIADDQGLRIWDREGVGPPLAETSDVSFGIPRFTPSGDAVLLARNDRVYRWDWKEGTAPRPLTGYRGFVNFGELGISRDGRKIVTAGDDRLARVWDADTGRELVALKGHRGSVNSAAFSVDGRFVVTASADKTAQIWDTRTSARVRLLKSDRSLFDANFDTTGTRVVGAGADGYVQIWDARSGRTVALFRRHAAAVSTVSFSPDGSVVLTASDDHTASIDRCPACDDLASIRKRAVQRLLQLHVPAHQTANGWSLAVGDCYSNLPGLDVEIVSCQARHDGEVFAVLEDPDGDEAPFDADRVATWARGQCQGPLFTQYVGVSSGKSRYEVFYYSPDSGAWVAGDRRVTCFLSEGDTRARGSARGTKR